ncbi:hypothetical protein HK101_007301 [Irineochytrium annulatum]|nr:hypothetical protein HK101_007301 [Irineochytrium annulatum]
MSRVERDWSQTSRASEGVEVLAEVMEPLVPSGSGTPDDARPDDAKMTTAKTEGSFAGAPAARDSLSGRAKAGGRRRKESVLARIRRYVKAEYVRANPQYFFNRHLGPLKFGVLEMWALAWGSRVSGIVVNCFTFYGYPKSLEPLWWFIQIVTAVLFSVFGTRNVFYVVIVGSAFGFLMIPLLSEDVVGYETKGPLALFLTTGTVLLQEWGYTLLYCGLPPGIGTMVLDATSSGFLLPIVIALALNLVNLGSMMYTSYYYMAFYFALAKISIGLLYMAWHRKHLVLTPEEEHILKFRLESAASALSLQAQGGSEKGSAIVCDDRNGDGLPSTAAAIDASTPVKLYGSPALHINRRIMTETEAGKSAPRSDGPRPLESRLLEDGEGVAFLAGVPESAAVRGAGCGAKGVRLETLDGRIGEETEGFLKKPEAGDLAQNGAATGGSGTLVSRFINYMKAEYVRPSDTFFSNRRLGVGKFGILELWAFAWGSRVSGIVVNW